MAENLPPPPDMATAIAKGWAYTFTRDGADYTLRMVQGPYDFTETRRNIFDLCCAMIGRMEAVGGLDNDLYEAAKRELFRQRRS